MVVLYKRALQIDSELVKRQIKEISTNKYKQEIKKVNTLSVALNKNKIHSTTELRIDVEHAWYVHEKRDPFILASTVCLDNSS